MTKSQWVKKERLREREGKREEGIKLLRERKKEDILKRMKEIKKKK